MPNPDKKKDAQEMLDYAEASNKGQKPLDAQADAAKTVANPDPKLARAGHANAFADELSAPKTKPDVNPKANPEVDELSPEYAVLYKQFLVKYSLSPAEGEYLTYKDIFDFYNENKEDYSNYIKELQKEDQSVGDSFDTLQKFYEKRSDKTALPPSKWRDAYENLKENLGEKASGIQGIFLIFFKFMAQNAGMFENMSGSFYEKLDKEDLADAKLEESEASKIAEKLTNVNPLKLEEEEFSELKDYRTAEDVSCAYVSLMLGIGIINNTKELAAKLKHQNDGSIAYESYNIGKFKSGKEGLKKGSIVIFTLKEFPGMRLSAICKENGKGFEVVYFNYKTQKEETIDLSKPKGKKVLQGALAVFVPGEPGAVPAENADVPAEKSAEKQVAKPEDALSLFLKNYEKHFINNNDKYELNPYTFYDVMTIDNFSKALKELSKTINSIPDTDAKKTTIKAQFEDIEKQFESINGAKSSNS